MCVVEYSSATRGRLYLCFRSFVVSIVKNRSENMINYITVMSQDIMFCVKCGENHISSCAPQREKGSFKFAQSKFVFL